MEETLRLFYLVPVLIIAFLIVDGALWVLEWLAGIIESAISDS